MTQDFTSKQRTRLLEALAKHANVSEAAKAAGIGRDRVSELRAADRELDGAWTAAIEAARDRLELAAWHRALEGIEEPYYYGGEKRGHVRRYSDSLLSMLLRAERPEKFTDRGARQGSDKTKLTGGVLVVPGKLDPESWAEKVREYRGHLVNGGIS